MTKTTEVCRLLQEIGLPAVLVEPASAEVIEFNELFSSLISPGSSSNSELWFVERVLPSLTPEDRASWEHSRTDQAPILVQAVFRSIDGSILNFEMRSFPLLGQNELERSILSVFIPFTTPIFERICDAHISEGRELERSRIRDELHQGASQSFLGAAFGCKLLAKKAGALSEGLGKEASDLADLVNQAVVELQKVVHSNQS
jgi:Histidine kinase